LINETVSSRRHVIRVIKEFLDRHYRRLLDEPLPATGNVSPHEAVGTVDVRAKVIGG